MIQYILIINQGAYLYTTVYTMRHGTQSVSQKANKIIITFVNKVIIAFVIKMLLNAPA